MTTAAMSGVPFKQQDAQITGNGTPLALPPSFRNHIWIIAGSAGVTSGVVIIENSNDPNDTNVWDSISGPQNVIAGVNLTVQTTGLFNIVRARISTPIVGGTVTVTYEGAKSY